MRTLLTLALAAMLALSGCIVGNDDAAPPETQTDHEPPAPTGPAIETMVGSTGNAVGTPLASVNNGGTYEWPLVQADNVTGWVLELTWEANDPASEDLDLWIRKVGDFALPPGDPTTLPDTVQNNQPTFKATGGSPLRLTATPDQLEPGAEYSILVRAATPAGAALEQSFTLNVATFDGVPFDAEYVFA